MSESNPLVQRVDALLKRHQQQAGLGATAPAAAQALDEPARSLEPEGAPATLLPPLDDTTLPESVAGEDITAYSPASPPAALDDDIPVLTEIVDPQAVPGESAGHAGKALVEEIEAAVIGRVLAELDRSLDMRLNRAVGQVLEQAMDGLRADVSDHVRRVVRESVAAALAKADSGGTDPT